MTTNLRELLSDAAQSDVRPDLAERAISGARTRRRQRVVVGGAVLAAAAVVLGVVIGGGNLRTDTEPRPTDVASLPEQLPSADGLPPLADGTMDAASAAYVVDGEVVVIDAASGDGAVVDFESMPLNFVGPMTGVTDRSVAALSPDGSALVVSTGKGEREVLLLVDVATGEVVPTNRFFLRQDKRGGQWSSVAWSPDSERFACICSLSEFPASLPVSVLTVDVTRVDGDLMFLGPSTPRLFASQISWGTDGLAAQFDENGVGWRLVPIDGQPEDPGRLPDPESLPPVESVSELYAGVLGELGVTALTMGHSDLGGFLARMRSGELWLEGSSGERTVVGNLGVRPTLGALGDSYFVVFTDWKGDPLDSTVTRIDTAGETTLTTLPEGARTVSFASGLVD
jgi:hypothetical protein